MTLTDHILRLRVMILTPIDCGLTYTLQVRIEALNLILCLIFGQMGIMNPDRIRDLREECKGHDKSGKVLIREGLIRPLSVS